MTFTRPPAPGDTDQSAADRCAPFVSDPRSGHLLGVVQSWLTAIGRAHARSVL